MSASASRASYSNRLAFLTHHRGLGLGTCFGNDRHFKDAVTNKKIYAAWEEARATTLGETYGCADWTNVRHWWRANRQTGTGLFSATTWSDPSCYPQLETQVSPKYQTAVGLGSVVFSPILWTVGLRDF
jgi:hypothetical protein